MENTQKENSRELPAAENSFSSSDEKISFRMRRFQYSLTSLSSLPHQCRDRCENDIKDWKMSLRSREESDSSGGREIFLGGTIYQRKLKSSLSFFSSLWFSFWLLFSGKSKTLRFVITSNLIFFFFVSFRCHKRTLRHFFLSRTTPWISANFSHTGLSRWKKILLESREIEKYFR